MTALKGILDLHELVLPRHYDYRGADLVPGMQKFLSVVPEWIEQDLLTITGDDGSFGMVVTLATTLRDLKLNWDRPSRLLGVALPYGDNGLAYVYNALNKLRPAARTGRDTLVLPQGEYLDLVGNAAKLAPGEPVPFGDFGHPGGVICTDGTEWVGVAVSGFKGRQNHKLGVQFGAHVLDAMAEVRTAAAQYADAGGGLVGQD
jgi:hypothetical protein